MNFINRWQCWLVGWWDMFKYGVRFCGCDMREEEFHENVQVVICRCVRCGKQDIGWGKNLKP